MNENKIRIYVANLRAYNEGELKGAWFTLPEDLETIFQTIFSPDELDENGQPYGDWAIHDYEAPFSISEYDSIDDLNEIAEKLQSLDDDQAEVAGELYEQGVAVDMLAACEIAIEGCIYYYGCKDMGDIAMERALDCGDIDENHPLFNYIDWDRVGRDMEINGTFFELSNGTWVEVIS